MGSIALTGGDRGCVCLCGRRSRTHCLVGVGEGELFGRGREIGNIVVVTHCSIGTIEPGVSIPPGRPPTHCPTS